MTDISLVVEDSNISLSVKGHSGYSSSGTDIVCAAISILTYSFSELCMELGAEHRIVVKDITLDSGYAVIDVEDRYGILIYPLQMLSLGLESIVEQYSDYARLKWGRN